jgi:hypothetical protein
MDAPQTQAAALPAVPAVRRPRWLLRLFIVGAAIGLWFLTQSLISKRTAPPAGIDDGMHRLLAPLHDYLFAHPTAANVLMIVSSGFIDALAIFILIRAIFGPTIRPFIGLFLLFCLRQLCQMLVSLPEPEQMIWRYPGCPAILVTYGVATDLFFSGHTSVAVYGSIELSRLGKKWLALGVCIAVFEMLTVLTLRAHYTMDVFAAFMTAFFAARIAEWLAPRLEAFVDRLAGGPAGTPIS